MKILITGLCLSRNLGGPAMGLTLFKELKKKYGDSEIVFAIEPLDYDQEKKWADYYGLEIVRRDILIRDITSRLIVFNIIKKIYRLYKPIQPNSLDYDEINKEFTDAVIASDLIIDMSGISYVGDSVGRLFDGVRSYSNYYYAKKHKKPFSRFIQSFGPFDSWNVRFFAKREFKQLDFIPARGELSASYCRGIVSKPEKVYAFPDLAILLDADNSSWTKEYLDKINFKKEEFYVLSPSSVIYNIRTKAGGSVGEKHVDSFYHIAVRLLEQCEKILFLPHMYSDNPNHCDRQICYKVVDMLKANNKYSDNIKIVEEDIDVMQAKGIINHSKIAVVSRYHALVAAISTATPVITLGWNVKYEDVMRYYDVDDFAIDIRKYKSQEIANQVSEKINIYLNDYNSIVNRMKNHHSSTSKKINKAFVLLFNWIEKNGKN